MAGLNDLLTESGSLKTPGLGDAVGGSSNKELMADARRALSGNWGMGVAGYVLYSVLVLSFYLFVFSSAVFVGMVSGLTGSNAEAAGQAMKGVVQITELLLTGAFTVGFCSYFLVIAQEGAARLECLFTGFRRFWTAFGACFLSNLFIVLWLLLLIVPGIIAAFRYAMVYFIVADDEDCGPLEAIRRSKEMMVGNKWKFFCLHWRFFGWALLASIFTLGIGYLWLVPYMQTSFAKFYEDVK
ncbi:MAG: DUF975 family protein [Verrucomicrobia bacterium]|nr:DUF975 family protein [Verrucomicrobiota bacterium]